MPKRPTAVTLSLDECEPNALPPVCCKCGQPATCEQERVFKWVTPWIALSVLCSPLVTLILHLVLQKKRTAYMPVCDKHSGVWNWGLPIMGFAVAAVVILQFAAYALAAAVGNRNTGSLFSHAFTASVVICVVGVAVGLLVLIGSPVARPITDDDMKLHKLAPEFVEAVVAQQDADDAAYAARRAARKPA